MKIILRISHQRRRESWQDATVPTVAFCIAVELSMAIILVFR
jgi:hypothetical protein